MRVTRIADSFDIKNGPNEAKLLEALVDFTGSSEIWPSTSVELEFDLEGDHGETYRVTTKLNSRLRALAPLDPEETVRGYGFQVILDQSRVNVEYFFENEYQMRGSFKDHDAPSPRFVNTDIIDRVPGFSKRN